ncbi:hypothetical protein niasHS_010985 [Heterodera schachtii]|uniref:Uncharacterized protein n=1 Tax=Heterodera schachtii TaxID=97005 RepID=A0ABD2J3L7_HETSC
MGWLGEGSQFGWIVWDYLAKFLPGDCRWSNWPTKRVKCFEWWEVICGMHRTVPKCEYGNCPRHFVRAKGQLVSLKQNEERRRSGRTGGTSSGQRIHFSNNSMNSHRGMPMPSPAKQQLPDPRGERGTRPTTKEKWTHFLERQAAECRTNE